VTDSKNCLIPNTIIIRQVSISLGNSNASNLALPLPLSVISSVTGGQSGGGQSILVNAHGSANQKV
jgi:hypothetical protein